VGPSIDSYEAPDVGGCSWYHDKIAFSSANNTFLDALQLAISINSESVLHLSCVEFLPIRAVDNSNMNVKFQAMPRLPDMQQVKLLTIR
jgi:hypothetical protein